MMKNIVFLSVATMLATSVSAQTSFTVKTGEKKYSFPITSEITVTNDTLWKPEVVEVEKKFKSIYTKVEPKFESSFSTDTQQSETGIVSVEPAKLIADNVWEIVFTTDDYKRVQMSVNLTPTPSEERPLLADKSNVQANLGLCATIGTIGDYFSIKEFGKNGKWAWIYNELSNSYVFINIALDSQGNDSINLSSLIAPKKFVEEKDLNINNVSDKWMFTVKKYLADGTTKDTLVTAKLKATPEYDKTFTLNGIPYHVNTGKVSMNVCDMRMSANFPDEYDIANGKTYEFRILRDNLITEDEENVYVTAGDYIPDDPAQIDPKENTDNPEFTIQDRNTFVSTNGMIFCKWKRNADRTVNMIEKYVMPVGTKIRRESSYPTDITQIKYDTIYVVKHDTVYLNNISVDDVIKYGKHATEVYNKERGVYEFASDNEFKTYASYYEQAVAKSDSDIPEESKEEWTTAVDNLKKVATSYGYYSQKLMNPKSIGKYLLLGQGAIGGFTFNFRTEIGHSTYANGYIKGNASGYVAYAKYDCELTDTTLFHESNAKKRFENGGYQGAYFGGQTKVDVYVIYNPEQERYIPIYIASNGDFIIEQWKGNTSNFYTSLDEAIQHFGCNSGNMADRGWVKANWSEDGSRVVVAQNKTDLSDLYNKYSDFSVVATGGAIQLSKMFTEGVTIDVSTTPFKFSKDGEDCDFSGYAIMTAKDSDGDLCELIITMSNSKYTVYSYLLDE